MWVGWDNLAVSLCYEILTVVFRPTEKALTALFRARTLHVSEENEKVKTKMVEAHGLHRRVIVSRTLSNRRKKSCNFFFEKFFISLSMTHHQQAAGSWHRHSRANDARWDRDRRECWELVRQPRTSRRVEPRLCPDGDLLRRVKPLLWLKESGRRD